MSVLSLLVILFSTVTVISVISWCLSRKEWKGRQGCVIWKGDLVFFPLFCNFTLLATYSTHILHLFDSEAKEENTL